MGNAAVQLVGAEAETIKKFVANAAAQITDRKLLNAETAAAKISLSSDEAAKILAEQYERAGGEAAFLERLKANNADPEFVKNMFIENETINRFLEKSVFGAISVGDDEIQKAYAQDKTATVRHILLLTQEKPASEIPEIRKKMEGLLVRAKAGEDFAALAKEFTEDPGSKENGGLYESFPRGAMVKPFEDAAFTVPVGQISDIVETEYGFHILKIESRAKETEPLENVKTQIADGLKQAKRGGAYEKYMGELRKKAKVVETKL
jgi:parvulin-like peptidyl-prolyl isomerase